MNQIPHSRAHIRLTSQADVLSFVQQISACPDTYSIESHDGSRRIDARSVLGVMYFTFDLQDEMFLVNESADGKIPAFVDQFRVLC